MFTSPGNYKEYFGMETDVDAVVYMMLMNNMLHDFFPTAVTVGECRVRWRTVMPIALVSAIAGPTPC